MADTQRQSPRPPPQPWFDPKTGNATEQFRRYITGEFSAANLNINNGIARASAAQATANAALQQANDVGADALPFSASASPLSATGSGISGRVRTNAVTVTPNGGIPPYFHSWTYVSGDAVTVDDAGSATTYFESSTSAESVYRDTVTDSTPGTPLVAVANVGISISVGLV